LSVRCECGVVVVGEDEDDLVTKVQVHARDSHQGLQVNREDVLGMAEPQEGDAERQ
jgi:predicted small metal-binding protein